MPDSIDSEAPGAFREELQSLLPMHLQTNNLDADSFHDANFMMTEDATNKPLEFCFARLVKRLDLDGT